MKVKLSCDDRYYDKTDEKLKATKIEPNTKNRDEIVKCVKPTVS